MVFDFLRNSKRTVLERLQLRIARLYRALNRKDDSLRVVVAYNNLAAAVEARFQELRAAGWFFVKADEDPGTFDEYQAESYRAHKFLFVSNVNHGHPYWTDEQNWKFRCTHEVDGHLDGNVDFSFAGELKAFKLQRAALGVRGDAAAVLFTEVVAQAAVASAYGFFDEQRAGILRAERPTVDGLGPRVGQRVWYWKRNELGPALTRPVHERF